MNAGILRLLWRNLMMNYKIDNNEEDSALCEIPSGAGREMKDNIDDTGCEVLRTDAFVRNSPSGSKLAAAVQEALSALTVDGSAASDKHENTDNNPEHDTFSFLQEKAKAGENQSDAGIDLKALAEDTWRQMQQEKSFSQEDALRKLLSADPGRITVKADRKMTSSYDGREILEFFKKWAAEPNGRDMSFAQGSDDAPEMTAHEWASLIMKQAGKHCTK